MENISFYIWIVCFILMSPTVKNAEENLASKLRAERMHRMKYFEIFFFNYSFQFYVTVLHQYLLSITFITTRLVCHERSS